MTQSSDPQEKQTGRPVVFQLSSGQVTGILGVSVAVASLYFGALLWGFSVMGTRLDSVDRRLTNLENGFLDLSTRAARIEGHLGLTQTDDSEDSTPDPIAQQ